MQPHNLNKRKQSEKSELQDKLIRMRWLSRIENVAWIFGFIAVYLLSKHPGSYTNIYATIALPFMGLCTLINLFQDCPRCNKPFYGTSHLKGNALRWSCSHCGLRRSGKNA